MDALKQGCRLLLSFIVWLPLGAQATVLFVVPSYSPKIMMMVNSTNQALQTDIDIRLVEDTSVIDTQMYRAVVLVGAQVLVRWQAIDVPTVAVLSSRQQVQKTTYPLVSAIYAEPSMHQQILLAETIVGPSNKIGILLQQSEQLEECGIDAAELEYHPLVVASISKYGSLNSALRALMKESSVLVGTYDTELYSNENIKNILITAYRNNQALVGPSVAYLRAGAIASVYSSADDIAKRLSEILQQGLTTGVWPEADYSPYFQVMLNQQVARSLNIELPNEKQLAAEIHKLQAQYLKAKSSEKDTH